MAERLTRSEVPIEQTWNLEHLFSSGAKWDAAFDEAAGEIAAIERFKGRLGEGASVLLECFDSVEASYRKLSRVGVYAALRASEDGTSGESQEMHAKARGLFAAVNAALSFLDSELVALPEGWVARYLEEEPALEKYRRSLERIERRRPHMLSPETETALAALGEVLEAPGWIYRFARDGDVTFDPAVDSDGNEQAMSMGLYEFRYESSPDTALRRSAFDSMTKGLSRYRHTYAATFATHVRKEVAMAKLRGYPTATHMLLDQQESTTDVYHCILDVIQTELAPHMRRLMEHRKRALGLETAYLCDVRAPLDPAFSPTITFAEAKGLLLDAFAVLGDEYRGVMEQALDERWVDWADNVGKSGGGFCAPVHDVHPYILLTWGGSYGTVFTLAHELGHAGHMYLASRHQTILVEGETSRLFIEAPSTLNELILARRLLAKAEDARMRTWVVEQLLATYHHNFVTHLLEGELERRAYDRAEQGGAMTPEWLSREKADILSHFWGDTVVIDDRAALAWIRQPHYYVGLYPYTYAAGLTAATVIAQAIDDEGEAAVRRWLDVLRLGASRAPLELLKAAGVDLTDPDVVRRAVAYVGSLVDEVTSA